MIIGQLCQPIPTDYEIPTNTHQNDLLNINNPLFKL